MGKLTSREKDVLHALSLRPGGGVVRDRNLRHALYELALKPEPRLVSDVYDMPSGGSFGRITEAGRRALQQAEGGAQ